MQLQMKPPPTPVWHEDSAIWEIIAGELIYQSGNPLADDQLALARRAWQGAVEAAGLLERGDADSCGHALIGSAVALGLAARNETAAGTSIEHYAGELASAISWQTNTPRADDLALLSSQLEERVGGGWGETTPTLWELAVRTGAHAGGLSGQITRRRQRRDMLDATG
jgi:hypothetical protein